MKKSIYLFTILSFLISYNLFAKDKLITIYDKDCGFCQNLLNETYQNDLVKEKLDEYEHLLFESETKSAIVYIEQYNITSYPTQIILKNGKTTLLKGFLNSNQQLEFLKKPIEFKSKLNSEHNILSNQQDEFLPKNYIKFLCRSAYSANRSGKEPFDEFMKMLQRLIDKKGLKVANLNKYAFENINKIICKNDDTISIRDYSTILKYAIDTANYKFIRGALLIKDENGKNICNPYIDFNRVEIIDGEEENLIQFIDKLLNYEGMNGVHDFHSIRSIRDLIVSCSDLVENTKELEEAHKNNIPETDLRKIRLKYAENFFEDLAVFKFRAKYGYINKEGKIVIPLIYSFAYRFENGKAKVAKKEERKDKVINYYINKNGKCVDNCE